VYSLSPFDLISASKTAILVVDAEGSASPVQVASTGSAPGRQAFPTWTPDGSRILFSAVRGSAGELWTVGADGKSPKLLLQRERNVFISPLFSPSGDRVYFGAIAEKSRDLGIWMQRLSKNGDVAGAPVELARTGTAIPMYLSVSRDGRQLAYSAIRASSHLWSLAVEGGEAKPVYQDNVLRASFPSISPDGRKVAFFSKLFGGTGDIWTGNVDGTGMTQMTSSGSPEVMPEWTSDGLSVRYGRPLGGGVQLWERRASDGGERPLTDASRQIPGWPRVSKDGTRVAWHSMHYPAPDEAALNISVATLPDLGGARQLTRDAEGAGFPAWSPDGKSIAYELLRGPHSYLAVMDADGSGQEQLNADPGHSWVYGWSPDGKKILFAGFREGTWNVWWMDRKTREQKRLTDYRSVRTFVRYPAWSPAGHTIVYELGNTLGNVFRLELP
jgi:TolB protein